MQSDFERSESGVCETSQEDFDKIMKYTESLLFDLDMNPGLRLESATALIAALAAGDEKAVEIAADAAVSDLSTVSIGWLTKFRELVRDNGPVDPQEAVQIILGLNPQAQPTQTTAPLP